MKKTILALTIPALFATSASAVTVYSDEGAQIDIYGRVQYEAGERGYQSVKKEKAQNFGGDGEARLGVNVKYMVNNDVDLIGKLEWAAVTEADDASDGVGQGEGLSSRYAWAGFRFMDTTELTFGRSMNPTAQVIYYTDVFNIYGADTIYSGAIGLDDKVDDQIQATYAANGVDLRAGYAFADNDKDDGNENKKNQWSVSAGYTLPMGLGFAVAYEQQEWGDRSSGNGDTDIDAWIAGVNYTIDGFYFAALYNQQEQDNYDGTSDKLETDGYELHAEYNVDAWKIMAQYAKEEAEHGSDKWDSVDNITLGVQYSLTPKAKLYAEYVISDSEIDASGDKKDDLYGVGIQYNF
ncbi:porin [Oceanimonas sp. MB9]|uniref:porin n=1 Tax=Oceanimonas sp. MB9 TaxID=2588453 RepID=UPI0013F5CEFB|nr:porin [Oceanimonas sp. MB9]NHI00485.1 Outer membrane protein F [Oceanimonas sp. MB9]